MNCREAAKIMKPPAADGEIERRTGPSRIGEASSETHLFDEPFRVQGGLDLAHAFPPPADVPVVLDFCRNLWR